MSVKPVIIPFDGSFYATTGLDVDGNFVCNSITPRNPFSPEFLDSIVLDTSDLIPLTTVSSLCRFIFTAGLSEVGDGGDALWARVDSEPSHAGKWESANGVWFEIGSSILYIEQFGDQTNQNDRNLAATIAFAVRRPLFINASGVTTYLDINPTTDAEEDTPESRHQFFAEVCQWHGTCRVPSDTDLVIRLANGYHSLSAWDALGTSVPIIQRAESTAPVLHLRGNSATILVISSITLGSRGVSDFTLDPPVIRYGHDQQITIVTTTALPSYARVRGYAVGLQNILGDGDAQCLSGAIVIETCSSDGLTITGTVSCQRTATLSSPASINSSTTYQGTASSRLIVPTACLGVNTSYTVAAAKTVTGVTLGAATTITIAAGHNFVAGDQVRFSGVGGTTQLNGQQLIVSAPVTATEFNLSTLESAALNSTSYDAFTSGGSVSKVTQLWTGSDYEAYIQCINGARMETRTIGISYVGYTGSIFAQDLLHCRDRGSRIFASSSTVLSGAGSRIIRTSFGGQADINATCIGNGGCQFVLGMEFDCASSIVRSWCGGARQYLNTVADNSSLIVSLSALCGGSAGVFALTKSFISVLSSRVAGNLTGIYISSDVSCRIDDSTAETLVNLNTVGLSRFAGIGTELGAYIGSPTFGTAAEANTTNQNWADQTTLATNAAFTLTWPTSAPFILHTGTLTADRAVTLAIPGAPVGTPTPPSGATFTITRTGAGAFNLNVGTGPLKALATNTWGKFTYDGSAWYLSAYGAL